MTLSARLPHVRQSIRLRALREDDLAVFLGYRSDPHVARFQGWWPMDEAKALAFLQEQGAKASDDASAGFWLQLAIADAVSDVLLGDLGVWLSHDRSEAELGITVAPESQGKGVGRNAMRAALMLLFDDPRVTCVRANADARNAPCRRMLVSARFRETGTQHVFVKEEACIEHQYIVERGDIASKPQGDTP
jgi:RimJ/RimL family protein N-acetyltransferase